MRVLGIETATWTGSVGIVDSGTTLAARTITSAAHHGAALLPLVRDVLAEAHIGLADVDAFAVSIGPGSFTGLRIGLSVAKGFALAVDRPLVGVSTLAAVAHALGPRAATIWPVLDARKGEVYAGAYRHSEDGIGCLVQPVVARPEVLVELLEPPCVLVGDGADAHAAAVRSRWGDAVTLFPRATLPPCAVSVAILGAAQCAESGGDDLPGLEPRYVRLPEAESGRSATN